MPGVARDHDLRFAGDFFLPAPLMQVSDQSLRRAANVVEVHRIRAHAGELRRLVLSRLAAFGLRYNSSDRPAPQTTRPERECAEKPVVQLGPLSGLDELGNGGEIQRGIRRGQQLSNVLMRR